MSLPVSPLSFDLKAFYAQEWEEHLNVAKSSEEAIQE